MRTISLAECRAILRQYQEFGSSLFVFMARDRGGRICAGTFNPVNKYMDPGKGDSGGPLQIPLLESKSHPIIQIGVTSVVTVAFLAENNLTSDEFKSVTLYTNTKSNNYTKIPRFISLTRGILTNYCHAIVFKAIRCLWITFPGWPRLFGVRENDHLPADNL